MADDNQTARFYDDLHRDARALMIALAEADRPAFNAILHAYRADGKWDGTSLSRLVIVLADQGVQNLALAVQGATGQTLPEFTEEGLAAVRQRVAAFLRLELDEPTWPDWPDDDDEDDV